MAKDTESSARNFIEEIIEQDKAQKGEVTVVTRFPPEPNGYPHIGHLKAICLNFNTAEKYGGRCNLRMDDTNPAKEDMLYVEAFQRDIAWMGYKWDKLCFGSDYFDTLYDCAVRLINKGLAYVCDLTADKIREYRGTLTEPGKNSPYRDRSVEENIDLFTRMKNGEFENGAKVLRAKIDMASPNINMRDPIIYRIMHFPHYRTGDKWCIYPLYDFAHPIQDAIEGVTYSLCSLEFEDHRPLYDWVVNNTDVPGKPRQIEFAKLFITRTLMSKRCLKKLIDESAVTGWDDPRMPTLSGMRRRGYTPEAIRDFIDRIGMAKSNSEVDAALLEHCVREDLAPKVPRIMAVLNPIKLTLTNYPEGKLETLTLENNPENEALGNRVITFGRSIYIDRDDFMENPPKGYFRLIPGGEVRLKGAYIIRCDCVLKDENGNITELLCSYDPETKSGGPSTKKVKGTIQWLHADNCSPAEFRLYDYLLNEGEEDYLERLNPDSMSVSRGYVETAGAAGKPGDSWQFMRVGYFCKDPDSTDVLPVFNRIVGLKDSWAKQVNKKAQG